MPEEERDVEIFAFADVLNLSILEIIGVDDSVMTSS